MHTPLCGHAHGSPESYVEAAARAGLARVTFSCHIPMGNDLFGDQRIRMQAGQLPDYLEAVEGARRHGESLGVEVLCGIEAEIFPEPAELELMDEILAAQKFDFVLGSLHHQLPSYQLWLEEAGATSDEQIISHYFSHIAEGAESGRYHSLAHPDVIRIYGTLRNPFRPEEHRETIESALDRIATTGVCLEVNTSGWIKGDYIMHPDPLILEWILARNIPLTIGSDAHTPEMVGQHFDKTLEILLSAGTQHLHWYSSGQRHQHKLTHPR